MTFEAINLNDWLKENQHLLKPPVGNYCIQKGGFTVMIVGGPNQRKEFHINPTAEWFFQYKGSMVLRVIEQEQTRDIEIAEKSIFLLPPNIPHSPIRYSDTIGIVVEQDRPAGLLDILVWFCQDCGAKVWEKQFYCNDLGTQILQVINELKQDETARICQCGEILQL